MQHDFPFDPTGGYAREQLIAALVTPLPAAPPDYVDFWTEQRRRALAAPLNWRIDGSTMRTPDGWVVREISFASMAGDHRVGGWLVTPRDAPVRRGFIWTHGYGGRGEPQFNLPADDAAVLFPVCTGLPSKSLHPAFGATAADHVVSGIGSPETYSHLFCAMDIWRALSVLLQAVPDTAARVDYIGESFGGGLGALALPWEPRFASAHLDVPSFGHHDLRLGLPCTGSGESVRTYVRAHPEARQVLSYFDAAVAAAHIRIPVHVAAALFDPAVPPAGQFAVYHALGGPKRLFVRRAGHFDHAGTPQEGRDLAAALREFFAVPLPSGGV